MRRRHAAGCAAPGREVAALPRETGQNGPFRAYARESEALACAYWTRALGSAGNWGSGVRAPKARLALGPVPVPGQGAAGRSSLGGRVAQPVSSLHAGRRWARPSFGGCARNHSSSSSWPPIPCSSMALDTAASSSSRWRASVSAASSFWKAPLG